MDSADAPPTDQSVAVYDDLAGRIDEQLSHLRQTLDVDLAAFNQLVRQLEIPAVVAKERRESKPEAPPPTP